MDGLVVGFLPQDVPRSLTGDVFASLRCDCRDQLEGSLAMVAAAECGVVIYLRQEGRGIGLANKIRAYALQDKGMDTVEANRQLGFRPDLRDYGIGAQILLDLGLHSIRLLTNNPKKTDAFIYGGFDLEVVDQVPIVSSSNEYNEHYLVSQYLPLGREFL